MPFKSSCSLFDLCFACFNDFLCQTGPKCQVRWKQRTILNTGDLYKSTHSSTSRPLMNCGSSMLTIRSLHLVPDCRPLDPYKLLEDDVKNCYSDIKRELRRNTAMDELYEIATYYLDGRGKALRPTVALLVARAVNIHTYQPGLQVSQRVVAAFSEMIHSASLIHDDVIDKADLRRGRPSANSLWNTRQVSMAGDFVFAVAIMMVARVQNNDITAILCRTMTDLVRGEVMQLGPSELEDERFAHYLEKSYRKTASLLANSSMAAAVLGGADQETSELVFQYGRCLGLAFQLVDDLMDFVSSSEATGKPATADLRLGLATAPVLFAAAEFPELHDMIARGFQGPGDVERAVRLVHSSRGLQHTRSLARRHCDEAARLVKSIRKSPYQRALVVMTELVANRIK